MRAGAAGAWHCTRNACTFTPVRGPSQAPTYARHRSRGPVVAPAPGGMVGARSGMLRLWLSLVALQHLPFLLQWVKTWRISPLAAGRKLVYESSGGGQGGAGFLPQLAIPLPNIVYSQVSMASLLPLNTPQQLGQGSNPDILPTDPDSPPQPHLGAPGSHSCGLSAASVR